MPKLLLAALLAAAPATLLAQGLEPGEWEFTTSMSGPMFPKPHTQTMKRCITKQESENPDRWGGNQKPQTDCKVNYGKKSADSMTWDISCPSSRMTGKGTVRMGRGTMQSELHMRSEQQGQQFEMVSKTSGKRLGPCKS